MPGRKYFEADLTGQPTEQMSSFDVFSDVVCVSAGVIALHAEPGLARPGDSRGLEVTSDLGVQFS